MQTTQQAPTQQVVNAVNIAATRRLNNDAILQNARRNRRLGHSMWSK